MTLDVFRKIRDLARQEERLRWAVKRQKAKCTRITPTYSNVPKGSGGEQRREDDMIRLVMVKEQHDAVDRELRAEREALRPRIAQLRDGTQRAAMTMRYMKNMRIIEIGDAVGYSERQVFRLLERAESEILQWLKGKEGQTEDGSTCQ